MSSPGYLATVRIDGIPTAAVGAALANPSGDLKTYVLSDASRRVISTATGFVLKKNGDPFAGTIARVRPLHGVIVLQDAQDAEDVFTLDYSYVPMRPVAEAREFSLQESRELLDSTVFQPDGEGAVDRKAGLKSASGSVGGFDFGVDPVHTGEEALYQRLSSGGLAIIEYQPGAGGRVWRGYVRFESLGGEVSVDDLASATLAFQSARHSIGTIGGQAVVDHFGWGPA